jgi:hypothetical protein
MASSLASFMRRSCPSQKFDHFSRVSLQDSPSLALHPCLAKSFPACGNQHQAKLASVKIQAIFELRSQSWIHFRLGALTDNDQKAFPLILSYLQPGELPVAYRSAFQKLEIALSARKTPYSQPPLGPNSTPGQTAGHCFASD